MSEIAVIDPVTPKAGRADSMEGTAKMSKMSKRNRCSSSPGEWPQGGSISNEEYRTAMAAISDADWQRIAGKRYASISIDDRRIIADGNDSMELANAGAKTGQRCIVVANPQYREAVPPRSGQRTVA